MSLNPNYDYQPLTAWASLFDEHSAKLFSSKEEAIEADIDIAWSVLHNRTRREGIKEALSDPQTLPRAISILNYFFNVASDFERAKLFDDKTKGSAS